MPDWKQFVRERLPRLGLRAVREAEVVEELAQLLEDRYAAAREEGLDDDAARGRAIAKFPSGEELARQILAAERPLGVHVPPALRAEAIEAHAFQTREGRMFHDFLQDIRYAFRTLLRSPGFALVAILTLALGMGANTAIFSVVNGVLLQALPFEHSDRLVILWETTAKGTASVAYPNFLDWRAQAGSFAELAALSADVLTLSGGESAERISVEVVDDAYFRVLGARPAFGRLFTPEELGKPMSAPVAVLGHGLWQRRYGGKQEALGQTVTVNGATFTIVGILPEGFRGWTGEGELWLPFTMRDALWPQVARFNFLGDRIIHWHRAIGRLRPGVSLEQARTELNGIAARLAQAYPKTNEKRGVDLEFARDRLTSGVRPALLVLLGTVGLVLLIACANLANLLLVRLTARQREIAIRLALGAGRARLARQLVTESLLLALLGGLAGILAARWGMDGLLAMLPITVPRFAQMGLNPTVLLFTLGLCLLTGVGTGLMPVWHALRPQITKALKEGAPSSGGGQHVLRSALVTGEIAVALVLLIGAGLMLQSFQRMLHEDPGFRAERLLMLRLEVPEGSYAGVQRSQLTETVRERLRAVPGVQSIGMTYTNPFTWEGVGFSFTAEGLPEDLQDTVLGHQVTPDYFQTLRIPLLAGREFTERDTMEAGQVAIVSEAFAQRVFHSTQVLGRRIKLGASDSDAPWLEIVGVAGNVKVRSLRQSRTEEPIVYTPLLQSKVIIGLTVLARTQAEPASVFASLRSALQQLDPQIPVYGMTTMQERMGEDARDTRAYALLISLFAVLAVVLAAVGIYGVMAHMVGQRTREIGLRMALGALPADALKLVLGQGARLALLGVTLGVAGAVAASRLLRTLVFGVSVTDGFTYAMAGALLLVIALLGCAIPAWRAARLDPLIALRHE